MHKIINEHLKEKIVKKVKMKNGGWLWSHTWKYIPQVKTIMEKMPKLNHWPLREVYEFEYRNSEVLKWIMKELYVETLSEAKTLMDYAMKNKIILFDQGTKLWCGSEYQG